MVRQTFRSIRIWQSGDPPEDGIADLELTARSGAVTRIRIDKASGGLIETT